MNRIKNFFRTNTWMMLMDIIAVNGAYLLALLIRFYVHFKFTSGVGDFREYYLEFTPYYTVLCVIVFAICGLYDGMWRYAGLDDMNRIIWANLITAVIQVAGTKIFVHGMPTSYYLIGAFLQFLFIALIRFAYRFLSIKSQRAARQKAWTIPAIVVGSGECAKRFINYLNDNTLFQAVAIAAENSGKTLNGVPIVDYDSIPMQSELHGVRTVFIADDALTGEGRRKVEEVAAGLEVMDYKDYMRNMSGTDSLSALLPLIDGPVTVVVDGVEQSYSSAQSILAAYMGSYDIKAIQAARIELKKKDPDRRAD